MVVDGQKGSHGDEAGNLGEGEERKKERNRGSGCRYQLEIRTLFFFLLFFVFSFFPSEGGTVSFFQSS